MFSIRKGDLVYQVLPVAYLSQYLVATDLALD